MKIKLFLAAFLTVTCMVTANAQFIKLHDFNDAEGSIPSGSLVSDGTFLYGMTSNGGTNNYGVVYKIKPNGTGFAKLFDFGGGTNGGTPFGDLLYDGTFLYGMTSYGGANGDGIIFKIKPDGTGFVKLLDFNITNGAAPAGSLISDGTYLYGMAQLGGANTGGVIFKIKPDGTGYVKLKDFTYASGWRPDGSLVSDGTYLYGMEKSGGGLDSGTIFKIKPDGTAYTTLMDFTGANGSYAHGSLIYDGTYLYGMTTNGGTDNMGVVFKIKPDGTGYAKLLDFTGPNGERPFYSSLFRSGIFLYGVTNQGGATGGGVVFKIKTDGTGYYKLMDFSPIDGQAPNGTLISDGSSLFGTAGYNGGNGYGTIYKLGLSTGIEENELGKSFSVYPNPSTGIFNLKSDQPENLKTKELKIYNVLSECIYQLTPQQISASSDLPIDLSSQPAGAYFLELQTEQGMAIKKIVIQK